MKKKKTLGTRIIIAVMAVLAYGILSAGITGTVCLVQQSNSDMKNSMSERVSSASNLLSSTIQHYVSMIATLDGTTAQVNDIIASDSNIVEINTHAEGSAGVTTNSDGYIVVTGTYPKGTASITTSTAWLGNIVNTMHTSDTTEFYLLTNDGRLLASMNGSLSAEQVAGYMNITDVETVSDNGRNHIVTASPILGTDWTAVVICDAKEFLGNAFIAVLVMIITTTISFVVGALVISKFVKRIIVPLNAINGKILDMEQGKLSGDAIEVHTGDELETLADAVNSMTAYTNTIIKDIEAVSAKLAAEDLTAEPAADYIGDYAPIKSALYGIINSTSDVIRQIGASSKLVSDGSSKMSDNSTTLSQAATEQAATVEELNASIVEISSNISANADSAGKAKVLADDCMKIVNEGNVKMTDMLHAMEEINETSSQIANIIKTIEDISFQTNILSLNASIEAARAGEAGKGFAVVAGEVGQLAGKTAEAAKNTTALIKTSLTAVENGTVMANETAKMLSKIVSETDDTAKVIDKIAAASQEQADSVKQILVGMDQISTSVQMTSGSSAECAASAEELSGQAKVLLDLVQRFKIADAASEKKIKKAARAAANALKSGAPAAPSAPAAPAAEKKEAPAAKPAESAETAKPVSENPAAKPAQNAPEKPAEKPKAAAPAAKTPAKPEAPKTSPKPAAPAPAVSHAPVTPAAPKPASAPKRTIVLDDDKY
ncbi:methyl-accepting chemotaxis protein [Ruminococcus callidus]|uniref:methyl-accepting chemotaxis protein n=1 Tax=Ruminococcus callidus TaxID=40519 RepID=UPI0023FA484F|nr:methyl-accepting chemotaxis protein [Ruminococcus callidus]